MIKLKLDDLLFLLDSKPHYDEVVCFARDLDPPELGQHVLKVELGKVTVGFAAGNCWRNVRIEEKLGIVVVSNPPDDQPNSEPSGSVLHAETMDTLHASICEAAKSTFGEPREMIERIWLDQMGFSRPIAMLRKVGGELHRNLVMERRSDENRGPGGMWFHYNGPLHAWVKQTLWVDVPSALDEENPKCLLSNCRENWKGRCMLAAERTRTPHAATCLGYERRRDDAVGDYTPEFKRLGELVAAQQTTKPFPGADAHPDKRGGELCVEGGHLTVAEMLYELAGKGHAESVNKCLRGLADWLKTQNWTGMQTFTEPSAEWIQREIERGYRSGLVPVETAKKKIAWAEAHGCLDNLVAQAREVIAAKGASSVMPLEVAKAILMLYGGRFAVWSSYSADLKHQPFIEEARRERETLETAARAMEVGKRYSAMSPEEFAALRKDVDAVLGPTGSTTATVEQRIWAQRLSRALDVIERVTDGRDRCTKARLAQRVPLPGPVTAEAHAAVAAAGPLPEQPAGAGHVVGENCPKCGSTNYGPDGAAMANCCWDCGHVVEEPECCDECGHLPAKGNVVYEDSGSRPLCKLCNPDVPKRVREEGKQQQAAQAGGGFRCPKCKMVFLDTGFPRLPGERGDGRSSGWRVTCPECKHEWNCLNVLPSIEDRLAGLEKDVRQLRGQEESREVDEKRAAAKQCGTCAEGRPYGHAEVRTPCSHYADSPHRPDGPPWDNCRFWKPTR